MSNTLKTYAQLANKYKSMQATPNLTGLKGIEGKKFKKKRGRRRAKPVFAARPYRESVPDYRSHIDVRSVADGCIIHGTDFLQNVQIISAAANSTGYALINVPINPAMMPLSRLRQHASLYEQYRFVSLKFDYISSVAIMDGQIVGYIDKDTMDNPANYGSNVAVAKASGMEGNRTVPVTTHCSWHYKVNPQMTDLYSDYTSDDPRWTDAGRFVLLISTPVQNSGSWPLTIGSIKVSYVVHFKTPQLDPNISGCASKWAASGSIAAATPWGTPVMSPWSNTDFAAAPVTGGNQFHMPPGCYLFACSLQGGTIAITTATFTNLDTLGTITPISSNFWINSAATLSGCTYQWECAAASSVTLNVTATTLTAGKFWVCSLPIDAVTLTKSWYAKKAQAERLIKALSGFQHEMREEEEKKEDFLCVTTAPAAVPLKSRYFK